MGDIRSGCGTGFLAYCKYTEMIQFFEFAGIQSFGCFCSRQMDFYILVDFLSEKIQQDEWSNLAAVGNIYVFIYY